MKRLNKIMFRDLFRLEYCKTVSLINQKAEANKETIESKDFQKWLIHIKAKRQQTTIRIKYLYDRLQVEEDLFRLDFKKPIK